MPPKKIPRKKVKLLVVGQSNVGKSCLINRLVDKKYIESDVTVSAGSRTVVKKVNDEEYKVEIWDTAGCERFQSMQKSFFRNAHGAILVYDITRRDSFDKLKFWLDELYENTDNPNIAFVVVGNKIDEERVISREEGEKFASDHGGLFMETSVKDDLFVDDVFNNIIEEIVTSEYYITDNSTNVLIIKCTININSNNTTTTGSNNTNTVNTSANAEGGQSCC